MISHRQADFQEFMRTKRRPFQFQIFWEQDMDHYSFYGHAYRQNKEGEWKVDKKFGEHVIKSLMEKEDWKWKQKDRTLMSLKESEREPDQYAYARAVSSSPFEIDTEDGMRVKITFSDPEQVIKDMQS